MICINTKVIISSRNMVLSSYYEDITSLNVKFIISSFDVNLNKIKLNRKTIDKWLHTLINQPVVGKIAVQDSGDADFTAHNMREVVRLDEDNNAYSAYEFDSSACGVFTSAQIEMINGKEYITAEAKIWKRFPEFCAVIKKRISEGKLSTSWEVATISTHTEMVDGVSVKVIDEGAFLGHSLLAKHIPPAYPESQLLEVAQVAEDYDNDLIEALNKDILNAVKEETNVEGCNLKDLKVTKSKAKEAITIETEELEAIEADESNLTNEASGTEASALTQLDLNKALREGIAKKLGVEKWDFYIIFHFPVDKVVWVQSYGAKSELDITIFSYEVGENDEVTVSDAVDGKLSVSIAEINSFVEESEKKATEMSEALAKANEDILGLKKEVAELQPFKEIVDKAEKERLEAEHQQKINDLKEYAVSSGLIAEDECGGDKANDVIQSAITKLDKAMINNIIAERFMEKQNEDAEVITSEKENILGAKPVKASIEKDIDVIPNHRKLINKYLGK